MIPVSFDYVRAESADHALELLAEHGDEAKLLAGGHSLLPLMKLRLAEPRESVLVTGLKRDVALVGRVDARPGDSVTVFDVSLGANRDAVVALLERGVSVRYFDHHFAGDPIAHPAFESHIDASPGVCSGILVDRYLGGRQRP